MSGTSDALSLIGRIFLSVVFVVSGFGKIAGFAGLVGAITSKGLPAAQVFAVATIVIEVGVGLMLGRGLESALGRICAGRVHRHRDFLLPRFLGGARSAENDGAD